MTHINDIVDERSIFGRVKEYKFSDTLKSLIGQGNYDSLKDSLYERFYERKINDGEVPSRFYFLLKDYNQKSYYSWAVDAIAQNISSLPFIFNDRYAPLKYLFQAVFNYQPPPDNDWSTAWATRLNAFGGNAMIGDIYRVWQDYLEAYMDGKLHISNDNNKLRKGLKNAFVDSVAFVTGQSWIYAGFLIGGNMMTGKDTDLETLAIGVISLSVFAPIIGPWTSKVYKKLRKACTLPPKTEFK
jgi:hypothetical protein